MMDRNDPKAGLIFKAAGFLNRIKNGCRQYINEPYDKRQQTFSEMKQECENLMSFSETAFPGNSARIKELTLQIMDEISLLSLRNDETEQGRCTVCNSETVTFNVVPGRPEKLTYCPVCPEKISNLLDQLEIPTEVMWI